MQQNRRLRWKERPAPGLLWSMLTPFSVRSSHQASVSLLLCLVFAFSINAQDVLADGPPVHVVSDGETISSLAQEHGISPTTFNDPNRLGNSDFIAVSQRLIQLSNESSALLPATTLRLTGVPLLRQKQTLTCEEAAAVMATRGRISESQLVRAMSRSANPFEGIRGRTNALVRGTLVDYGTYAQALQTGLKRLGIGSAVLYGQSYSAFKASIIAALKAGQPVVWWTTFHEQSQSPVRVQLSDGRYVKLVRFEHAGTIVGMNAIGFIYYDPVDGTVRTVSFAAHQRTSSYFDNMALIAE